MNLIFDGNYLYHKCFSVFASYYREAISKGEITMSEVLSDHDKQQVLIRKCVIDLCSTVQRFKTTKVVTVVIDSTSWRHTHHDNYKYSATKAKNEYQNEFIEVLDQLEVLLRKRGLIVSRVAGAEGDDLLYFWASYFGSIMNEQVVIVSADADIRQLITENVSIFNSNSKNLKMYSHENNAEYWNEYLNDLIEVEAVDPIFITISKAILGDSGDNIPTVKKGFGIKSFEKFYETLHINTLKRFMTAGVKPLSIYLAKNFCKYTNSDYETTRLAIQFNLEMAWLNFKVYQSIWGNDTFIDSVLESVYEEKDSYSYNKSFTLEDFYGMLLK